MQEIRFKPEFSVWRQEARRLLDLGRAPPEVVWKSSHDPQEELEGLFATEDATAPSPNARFSVPAEFMKMAPSVAAHRDDSRWALLYRVLWRLTHGEPELLQIAVDEDVAKLHSMYRSVHRDLHKMKAFVRFREALDPENGEKHYIAWYEPDHLIVPLAAPFFRERFQGMHWSILTADACAHWDRNELRLTAGVSKNLAPRGDDAEALWKTYYASIFNPARIKTRAMKKELPVRYWKNLPETALIPELIQQAPARLQAFYENQPVPAETYLPPPDGRTLENLRHAASGCRACPLCEKATQTVFGEGPRNARIVIIGEQPGDREDLSGRPFQGPAGELLNLALEEAGLKREDLYLTNAVKHFKWTPQGKVRLHQRPNSGEVAACKPWLAAEMDLLRPEIVICLGATAAQSVFGKAVTLEALRDGVHDTAWCRQTFVTNHPAAILRADPSAKQAQYARFVDDLKRARDRLKR